jgi:hypothetical protein
MPRKRSDPANSFEISDEELSGFLADEGRLDRAAMWRLGSWGAVSVGALAIALFASQSASEFRRLHVATDDAGRQSLQIERLARESQSETRRLAAEIETLLRDRDRLQTRVATLEQGLDSVTGSIERQSIASLPPAHAPSDPPPIAAPVTASAAPEAPAGETATPLPAIPTANLVALPLADTQATVSPANPLMATPSILAPPDRAAQSLEPVPVDDAADSHGDVGATEPPSIALQRTEFGIDIGAAKSVDGLRQLWQRLLKSEKALNGLRPIIVIRERTGGPGTAFHLVAGPLRDAAAAARLCVTLTTPGRPCTATVFDGQSLTAMVPAAATRPVRKRNPRPVAPKDTSGPAEPAAPKPGLTSLLGIR